ncbi:MAG: hypothetical protein V1789_02410 [PVC group bacterium]
MRFSTDRLWITGLCLGVIILLAPMLLGWRGVFIDDFYETFSRLLFNARSVSSGSLPLWDNQTFAGGRINFIPNTTIWYWPLYPFYLLAPVADVDAAYAWLIKVPLLLHWLICALGAYALGRGAMKLRPAAAGVLAGVYSLGAAMTYNILDPSTTYATAWLPLLIWGTVAFARRPSPWPLAAAAAAFAFIGPCGSDVRGIFSLASAAILFLTIFVVYLLRKNSDAGWRILKAFLLVTLLGLLLSAPYWTSMIETLKIYRDSPLLDPKRSASEMFSVDWPYLLTLVVPDAFGTLTNYRGADLGVSYLREFSYLEGNLTGGFWLILLCLAGSVAGWKGRDTRKDETGVWWWTGLVLFLFSLYLVTGRYSPTYLWLARVFPLFGLPYAVRWRILQHLGLALLAGVSAHWLLESGRRIPRWLLLGLPAAVLAGLVLVWSRPEVISGGPIFSRAWSIYRGWLFSSPLLYLALALAGSLLLAGLRRGGREILISAVFLEVFLLAYAVIYFLSWGGEEVWVRFRFPTETLYWRLAESVYTEETPVTGPERTVFDLSQIDQMATTVGGEYLFGHCSKPLAPRLHRAAVALTFGHPYQLAIQDPSAAFFPNMSVRKMILRKMIRRRSSLPDRLAEKTDSAADLGIWTLYRLPGTLPRVFTQDVIAVSSSGEAFHELLTGDLRRAAYVEDGNQLSVIGNQYGAGRDQATDHGLRITDYASFSPPEESTEHFDHLQQANRIKRVSIPQPTRMVIEAEIRQPALLVTTDVFHPDWEVSVDGEEREQIQVNYLQRAVPVRPGDRTVEWVFRPPAVRWGFGLFAFGLTVLGGIIIRLRRSRRSTEERT